VDVISPEHDTRAGEVSECVLYPVPVVTLVGVPAGEVRVLTFVPVGQRKL
jgi:hypothetical protein